MIKLTKILGMVLAMLFVLGLAMARPAAAAPAAALGCDNTGTVDGSATPNGATVGDNIIFRGNGFTANEDVSFYFTLPDGRVFGTSHPLSGGVHPDGTIGPLTFPVDQQVVNASTGRWAVTFEGASSHHKTIIYFCIYTTAQATQTAQAPAATNTAAPAATNTTAPAATNTAVPASTNTAAPAVTSTPAPSAVATNTAAPTVEATNTAAPTVAATTTVSPPAELTPTAPPVSPPPGMPITGQPDLSWLFLVALLGLSLVAVGWLASRLVATRR